MADPAAVETLRELVARDDLPSLLADVLIACALVRADAPTPQEVARHAATCFGWSEQTWRETVEPHLRGLLAEPGPGNER